MKKKISTGILLAAALALLTVTALAAGNANLFRFMRRSVHPIQPLDGAEELIVDNLASASNDYVTVTVEEAVYDGQGAMVLARLTLKDPAQYALLTDSYDEEELRDYDVEYLPCEVGQVELLSDERFGIRNDTTGQALLVDGEEVEIPSSEEDAQALGYPVYRVDGKLYWTGDTEPHILGRKDGRQIITCSMNLDTVRVEQDDGTFAEVDDPFDVISADEELQRDGSILYWFDCFGTRPLTGDIRLRVRPYLTVDGAFLEMEPVVFTLRSAAEERILKLIPAEGEALGGGIDIHAIEIHQTRVRGYLRVDFAYAPQTDDPWVDFALYDADGAEIPSADAGLQRDDPGDWHWFMDLQAFDTIPDTLVLEASSDDGTLGRISCRVEEG